MPEQVHLDQADPFEIHGSADGIDATEAIPDRNDGDRIRHDPTDRPVLLEQYR